MAEGTQSREEAAGSWFDELVLGPEDTKPELSGKLLLGPSLSKPDFDGRSPLEPLTFERTCVDILREINETGLRSYSAVMGVGIETRDSLYREFVQASEGNSSHSEFFGFGLALGVHVVVEGADPERAWLQGMAVVVSLTRREIDIRGIDLSAGPMVQEVIATKPEPPGFSRVGLLNLVALLTGRHGKDSAALTVSIRAADRSAEHQFDEFVMGVWAGVILRSRCDDLQRPRTRPVPDRDRAEAAVLPQVNRCILTCGSDLNQATEAQLSEVWLNQNAREGWQTADSVKEWARERLTVHIAIFSCQGVGELLWWPMLSFVRPGDLVLVRLAEFPVSYRGAETGSRLHEAWEKREWEGLLEDASGFLPEGIQAKEIDLSGDGGNQHFKPFFVEPEPPDTIMSMSSGLAGLALVTGEPKWVAGNWRATVGMFRPFDDVLTLDRFCPPSPLAGQDNATKLDRGTRDELERMSHQLPLYPEQNCDNPDPHRSGYPSALGQMANRQFKPELTLLAGDRWRLFREVLHSAYHNDGDLQEDLDRLELASENLRLGTSIQALDRIAPRERGVKPGSVPGKEAVHFAREVSDVRALGGRVATWSFVSSSDLGLGRWEPVGNIDELRELTTYGSHPSNVGKNMMLLAEEARRTGAEAVATFFPLSEASIVRDTLAWLERSGGRSSSRNGREASGSRMTGRASSLGPDDLVTHVDPAGTRVRDGWRIDWDQEIPWFVFLVDPDSAAIDIRALCWNVAHEVSGGQTSNEVG